MSIADSREAAVRENLNEFVSLAKCVLHPTGSRYFGTYGTQRSDWDFYCRRPYAFPWEELEQAGWANNGGSSFQSSVSWRKGDLNVIVAETDEAFDALFAATRRCVALRPDSRQQVIKIFQEERDKRGVT